MPLFALAFAAFSEPSQEDGLIENGGGDGSSKLHQLGGLGGFDIAQASDASPSVRTSPADERTKAVVSPKVQTSSIFPVTPHERHGTEGPVNETSCRNSGAFGP